MSNSRKTPLDSLHFIPGDHLIAKDEEKSILDLALDAKIPLDHSCGGNGTCGTCRVFIEGGLELLPPRNDIECEFAEERGWDENERLGCQCPAVGGLLIRVPDRFGSS